MKKFIGLFLLICAVNAFAGGSSFKCEIKSFEKAGKDKYDLVVRPLEELDIQLPRTKDGLLFFHIQHSTAKVLPSSNKSVTHAEFDEAIQRLKIAAESPSKITRFGYMGSAYRYIDGQPGHYRVYGLRIDEELTDDHKGYQTSVYAY
jgi:hypothetical protein